MDAADCPSVRLLPEGDDELTVLVGSLVVARMRVSTYQRYVRVRWVERVRTERNAAIALAYHELMNHFGVDEVLSDGAIEFWEKLWPISPARKFRVRTDLAREKKVCEEFVEREDFPTQSGLVVTM